MSIVSQKMLDELNEADRNKSKLSPSELEKFNQEYNLVMKELERKKKEAEDKEANQDASHIPGLEPDGESEDDGDASHIPD